jgi:hypothetical protein
MILSIVVTARRILKLLKAYGDAPSASFTTVVKDVPPREPIKTGFLRWVKIRN